MKHIHGGDIYADNWNEEPLDFSANINPLGMPDSVREAAQQAIAGCLHYPDPFCRALRRRLPRAMPSRRSKFSAATAPPMCCTA